MAAAKSSAATSSSPGLRKACSKRNVPVAQLEAAALEIETRVFADGRPEVPSTLVGELAMESLRSLDHIAYIRFASVYRPFADLTALKEAVEALEGAHRRRAVTVQFTFSGEAPDQLATAACGADSTARITSIAGAR